MFNHGNAQTRNGSHYFIERRIYAAQALNSIVTPVFMRRGIEVTQEHGLTTSSSTLLETACRKIQDLAEPAYIKDSTLRIFAANKAFAGLFGFAAEDVVGILPENLVTDYDISEWCEKERHTFLFGEDQVATFSNLKTQSGFRIEMERFFSEADEIFIFGQFMPLADPDVQNQIESLKEVASIGRRMAQDDLVQPADTMLGIAEDTSNIELDDIWSADVIARLVFEGINGLDAGILVYDADGFLRYANSKFFEMEENYRGQISVGMHVYDIVSNVHDLLVSYDPDMSEDAVRKARTEWIEGRLANHRQPYHEILSDMGGGRWVRVMNRCLENGVVISLRIDISEQKALELKLQKQMTEVRIFKAVLEDLPVAAYIRDQDLKLLFGNEAYVELVGKPLEGLIGKPPEAVFGPKYPMPSAYNMSALETGEVQAAEFEFERPDGDVVATFVRARRITTDDKNRFVIGSLTDVTKIRDRERELIRTQNQAQQLRHDLENIIDLISAGMLVLDQDMKIELVNKPLCDFVQVNSKSQLIGMNFRDYLKEGISKFRPDLASESVEKTINEWVLLTRNGTDGGVELALSDEQLFTYSATPFGDGRVVVTYTNITEIRRSEQEISETRKALAQTGALLKEASSVMEQGLLVVENDTVIFVNKAYQDMLDLPANTAHAMQTFETILRTLIARGEFEQASKTPSLEYRNFLNSYQVREPYSSVVYLEKLCRWIKIELIPAGENRVVFVFNNVTELKLREIELEKMLVRAEAADRAKSEFLANMSHEIRTPMNGVLAMSGLLASTELDTRQKTFLDVVIKSGKTLLTIINDVLDFSRMDGGQLVLKHVVFSPTEAVEDVALLMASKVSDKRLDFVVEIAPDVPGLVRSDAGRFRQILTNVLSNAIKFTDAGHVLVRLGAATVDDGSCQLKLTIEDSGKGISAEKIASIEKALASDESSNSLYPEGAGLGLPITIGLLRLFGGEMKVRRANGHGTIVDISLPVEMESARPRSFMTPVNIARSRILVIDDYEVSRSHITGMLSAWGFEVAGAHSSHEGLEILSAAHAAGLAVDAVVIDYEMSDLRGTEIVRKLRAEPLIRDIAVIFVAELDHIADEALMNALDIKAVVARPVRRGQLHESLVNILQARLAETNVLTGERVRGAGTEGMEGRNLGSVPGQIPTSPDSLHHVSVLVADDSDINRIVFAQILDALGVSHSIVSNGAEAVSAWKNNRPDIILMDTDMRLMDGYEATKHIREFEKNGNVNVVIIGVTSHSANDTFTRCLDSGMNDCLSKPLSPDRLKAILLKWTGTQTGQKVLAH